MAIKAWYQYNPWNNFMQVWNGQPINGDDIAMPEGTPVTAIFPGTVTSQYVDSSGGVQIIKVDNPSQTRGVPYYYFAHFDTFASGLKQGDHVNAGDVIGTSGGQNSGGTYNASPQWSTGPHIMIGLSKANSIPTGKQVTPDLNPSWLISYASGQKLPVQQTDFSQQVPASLNPIQDFQDFITGKATSVVTKWGEAIAIFILALLLVIIGIVLLTSPTPETKTVNETVTETVNKSGRQVKKYTKRSKPEERTSEGGKTGGGKVGAGEAEAGEAEAGEAGAGGEELLAGAALV